MKIAGIAFLLASLLILSSCGSSGSDTRFGSDDSLHPRIESILNRRIDKDPNALLVAEADAIKKPILPEPSEAPFKSYLSPADEAALLAQFTFYPEHLISSRSVGSNFFISRDGCLSKCVELSRCGAATYEPLGGICILHGPTLPFSKLSPIVLQSKSGLVKLDTYQLSARNQDYKPDGWVYSRFAVSNGDTTRDTPEMKVLYTDGTESDWINLGAMPGADPYGDLERSTYVNNARVPSKTMEGAVVSMTGHDGVGLGLFAVARLDDPESDDPQILGPFFSWLLAPDLGTEPLELNGKCDNKKVTDGCMAAVAFKVNPAEWSPFFDATALSLDALQKSTDELSW